MKKKILLATTASLLIANCLKPAIVSAQVKELWGMTLGGGSNNGGVIFKTDSSGNNETVQYNFDDTIINGIQPFASLIQASDGNLYGMTTIGGANNLGVLFQYNPATSTYAKKIDFNDTTNGSNPSGSLIRASDGNLYGMTVDGGANGDGVLFQYNPFTSVYTKKIDFDGSTSGDEPNGSLMQASDGNLYGMTFGGGVNNVGVLFQYNPATSVYTKKLDFDGLNGGGPLGSLMQASDGNIYGMTGGGGANNYGNLFQFNPATFAYTDKFDFDGSNGAGPQASLIQASDGNLYGTTEQGGANNLGVLFQYNPATSTYTDKFDFDSINGINPFGSLMQASDGNLYGMTYIGGAIGAGVLFQYNPASSAYTKKLDFDITNGGLPYYTNLIEITVAVTGIENYSSGDFIALYPNPANKQLTIHTSSFHNEAVTVSIMNVLGQTMQQEKTMWSNNIDINIKNLSAGIYFLEMKSEGGSVVKKFVKE